MMKFDFLINKLKEKIYPYTHINAVLTDDENKNLNDLLTDFDSRFDEIQESTQSDWNETSPEAKSYINNKPSSLPADGGNADTVDGKHASEFASLEQLTAHTTSDTAHSLLLNKKLDAEKGERLFHDVVFDLESGVIEFKRLDNSTLSVNIPVGLLTKSGHFDNDTKEIVLVLKNDDEIRIPAISLVDVYTGSENNVVQLVVGSNNVISAIVKQGSITKELFSIELQTALNSLEAMKHEHGNFEAIELITDESITQLESAFSHSETSGVHVPSGGTAGQIFRVGNDGTRQWIDMPDFPDLPSLGTASLKDIAATGNASATQVVMGNDTRLTDSRIASDVSAWAKASAKPVYTKSEIGLGNVDNTADSTKNVLSASKLTTPRTINGVGFDGTANITLPTIPTGYKSIIYSATEPTTVAVDQIVFVYE